MVGLVGLLTTYSVKVLLGIAHLRQVPALLFKDVGLLKRIGWTATQVREGICKRGKGKSRQINKFPLKKENAVRAHTILTLLMYGINAAYQTEQGQEAVKKGIRRLRQEDFQSIHKVVVYSDSCFGIFDIEEYSLITRASPKDFVRTDIAQTRKRLGIVD